jgi:RNA polymerase sigma factor (TIGR02999 family)
MPHQPAEPESPGTLTSLLRAWHAGDSAALEELVALVYDELRDRARRYLRRERKDHTLQPTALAHEAFLRLQKSHAIPWENRGQFFGVAAITMRRILVEHARRRRSARRGGSGYRVPLDDVPGSQAPREVDLLDLDAALLDLARRDAAQVRLVELRYFGGMSIEETAEALGVSPATAKREWDLARAWLYRRLKPRAAAS